MNDVDGATKLQLDSEPEATSTYMRTSVLEKPMRLCANRLGTINIEVDLILRDVYRRVSLYKHCQIPALH